MIVPQALIFAILAATVGLFLWGRLRHDVVALAALLACVLAGLVPAAEAFAGFGHPVVVTVASVLVLSRGLQDSGAVDRLVSAFVSLDAGRLTSMLTLMGLGAALSGFMNNVGAMALLMPVAVQLAGRLGLAPGQMLMPLAFATILGGMTTLLGTPGNLIVSDFRAEAGLGSFAVFDFALVGVTTASLGVAFVAAIGWRLVPVRQSVAAGGFDTGAYLTKVRVPESSKAVGMTLRAFEDAIADSGAQILGLVLDEVRMAAPHGGRRIRAGDILALEADIATLAETLSVFDIKLEEERPAKKAKDAPVNHSSERASQSAGGGISDDMDGADAKKTGVRDAEALLREVAVLPDSSIVDRSAAELQLRTRYGVNLLAVSREGRIPSRRLRARD